MSDEYQRIDRDGEAGSIGIGAMIVFIALILVAAVASTIIIKTAEELQQNAESTSDDTRKEISGKISIIQVVVNGTDGTDINSMQIIAKVASGSMDVLVNNVAFLITCGDATTYGLVTANLGLDSPWGQTISTGDATGSDNNDGSDNTWTEANAERLDGDAYEPTDELAAGTTFKFDVDLDKTTAGVADGGACKALAGVGETLLMKILVDGGGTTISELNIDSVVSGKAVV
jgi:archaellin